MREQQSDEKTEAEIEALADITQEEAKAIDFFMNEHMYHHRHVAPVYAMACDVRCRTEAIARAVNQHVLMPRRAASANRSSPGHPTSPEAAS